ncbi:DNA-processing protein DprA [Marinobacter sp.]|uniref:DNA-processing protein DprA n=1 Tax=Marinobacter sp. TaxID=50741 RepID=UPI000C514793|nr:DNA-processing protein DprA [Marinobacter sp.]MBE95560.1 DNA processing protein DprA [Marinobacter sp.]|tara:strand:+ start:3235 stop:4614 length:1380 start_codon:yes stop_codon:yes gene_type:complete
MLAAKTQAILLLTAYFSRSTSSEAKPLTNKEWGRFAFWLKNQEMYPEDLLTGDLSQKLEGWTDSKITSDRIQTLLNRGSALAMAMEKWTRSGLWVLTRSDSDYPKRLKARLGNDAPPVFFGCGNRNLLNQGGIAVIGSRKTSDADLQFSRDLGAKSANDGRSVVSGGAKGVDEAAMLGALESEGTAIGVLANDLLRAATSAKYRKYLMANNLVLLSPFYPEAGFNAGNAMQRNKYIYCLADAAIAVHSGTSGGTWNGVLENIKHNWVPMWVKSTDDPEAGNATLVQKGAKWLPENLSEIGLSHLLKAADSSADQDADLFAQQQAELVPETLESEPLTDPGQIEEGKTASDEVAKETAERASKPSPKQEHTAPSSVLGDRYAEKSALTQLSLYDHFLLMLRNATGSPKTIDELLEATQLHKTQLSEWLKQAVADDKVTKLSRPVRYQWVEDNQRKMFEDQ